MNKQIETKKKRHEIYDWIDQNVGEIPRGKKGYLKELLVEYVQIHNNRLVKLTNELYQVANEKSRLLDIERGLKARNKHNEKTHIKRDLILE
ncbi:hypothetical protein EOL99_03695 [Candidatus Falkowbacteria bacterium]|nr:hypothetical protein [Candidatus Falkowbacteria bacterium]